MAIPKLGRLQFSTMAKRKQQEVWAAGLHLAQRAALVYLWSTALQEVSTHSFD